MALKQDRKRFPSYRLNSNFIVFFFRKKEKKVKFFNSRWGIFSGRLKSFQCFNSNFEKKHLNGGYCIFTWTLCNHNNSIESVTSILLNVCRGYFNDWSYWGLRRRAWSGSNWSAGIFLIWYFFFFESLRSKIWGMELWVDR